MLRDLRESICDALRSRFGPIDVQTHRGGAFVPGDLKAALGNRHVAIRVGILGVTDDASEELGPLTIQPTWVVYLCAKDGGKDGLKRDEIIHDLAFEVMALASARPWSAPAGILLGKTKSIRFSPGYLGDAEDTANMAVWSVTWKQPFGAEQSALETDLRPLLKVITRYDVVPADGTTEADDTIEPPQT